MRTHRLSILNLLSSKLTLRIFLPEKKMCKPNNQSRKENECPIIRLSMTQFHSVYSIELILQQPCHRKIYNLEI